MEQEQNLAVVAQTPLMNESDLENAIKTAERTEELIRKIKVLAIRQTNKHDWVDMGGKPYLQSSGAEKIARLFGISWRICEDYPKKEIISDENGSYYMYVFKGEFVMGGKSIEAVGTCGQKDKFLGQKGGELKIMSEIDESAIIKKANTNMVGRGITTILGIRNLTWEEINGGGISKENTNKVNYAAKELAGIIKSFTKKDGTTKSNKPYTLLDITLEDSNGKINLIRTFDNKDIEVGYEIKALDLTPKNYQGNQYYEAKKIEIIANSDGIGG